MVASILFGDAAIRHRAKLGKPHPAPARFGSTHRREIRAAFYPTFCPR
jgi:hypothetical protein